MRRGARFADRHGVTLSCFDYWRRQVLGAGRETAGFAPVRVIGDERALPAGLIEVVLTNGERMLVREGVSADLVRAVVVALRSAC